MRRRTVAAAASSEGEEQTFAGVKTIAEGSGIRELSLRRQRYGVGYWRKKKRITLAYNAR
ncbi:MAG: hypothetical protein MUE59_15870 [Thiobacillaceae bacterium]|jgi:hypothetical protein|nr:hypothetical protein [Thiobacillaceae bacterium]